MLGMTSVGPTLNIQVPLLVYNNKHQVIVVREGYHFVVPTSIPLNIMARRMKGGGGWGV